MANITLTQLQRISPTSADEMERCPWGWHQLRVKRSAQRPQSRPMLRGSVFHEAVDRILSAWAGGEEVTPALVGRCLGDCTAGVLTPSEIREIEGAAKWFRPPCERDRLIAWEPAIKTAGGYPTPHPTWPPVAVDGFGIWGIPDVIYLDEDDRPVILDWKTGFRPKDPDGYAPAVYGAMLEANWARLCEGELLWPIRVVHRFVMVGKAKGTRERVFYPDDIRRDIARLEALVHRAQEWHETGSWPRMENEYCASCPFLGQCPAWADRSAKTVGEAAAEWLRLDAERKRAEADAKPLVDVLQAAACAGETVTYPDGKRLQVVPGGSVSWRLRSHDDLLEFVSTCHERGLDPMEFLTVDGRAASAAGLKDDPAFARWRSDPDTVSVTVRRAAS